jgi:hypothetical protein
VLGALAALGLAAQLAKARLPRADTAPLAAAPYR